LVERPEVGQVVEHVADVLAVVAGVTYGPLTTKDANRTVDAGPAFPVLHS